MTKLTLPHNRDVTIPLKDFSALLQYLSDTIENHLKYVEDDRRTDVTWTDLKSNGFTNSEFHTIKAMSRVLGITATKKMTIGNLLEVIFTRLPVLNHYFAFTPVNQNSVTVRRLVIKDVNKLIHNLLHSNKYLKVQPTQVFPSNMERDTAVTNLRNDGKNEFVVPRKTVPQTKATKVVQVTLPNNNVDTVFAVPCNTTSSKDHFLQDNIYLLLGDDDSNNNGDNKYSNYTVKNMSYADIVKLKPSGNKTKHSSKDTILKVEINDSNIKGNSTNKEDFSLNANPLIDEATDARAATSHKHDKKNYKVLSEIDSLITFIGKSEEKVSNAKTPIAILLNEAKTENSCDRNTGVALTENQDSLNAFSSISNSIQTNSRGNVEINCNKGADTNETTDKENKIVKELEKATFGKTPCTTKKDILLCQHTSTDAVDMNTTTYASFGQLPVKENIPNWGSSTSTNSKPIEYPHIGQYRTWFAFMNDYREWDKFEKNNSSTPSTPEQHVNNILQQISDIDVFKIAKENLEERIVKFNRKEIVFPEELLLNNIGLTIYKWIPRHQRHSLPINIHKVHDDKFQLEDSKVHTLLPASLPKYYRR